jgi:hypothetical protein
MSPGEDLCALISLVGIYMLLVATVMFIFVYFSLLQRSRESPEGSNGKAGRKL